MKTRKEVWIMTIVLWTVLFMWWFVLCMFLATIWKVNLWLEQYDIYHWIATNIYALTMFIWIILQA